MGQEGINKWTNLAKASFSKEGQNVDINPKLEAFFLDFELFFPPIFHSSISDMNVLIHSDVAPSLLFYVTCRFTEFKTLHLLQTRGSLVSLNDVQKREKKKSDILFCK